MLKAWSGSVDHTKVGLSGGGGGGGGGYETDGNAASENGCQAILHSTGSQASGVDLKDPEIAHGCVEVDKAGMGRPSSHRRKAKYSAAEFETDFFIFSQRRCSSPSSLSLIGE